MASHFAFYAMHWEGVSVADHNFNAHVDLIKGLLNIANIEGLGSITKELSFSQSTKDLIASRFLSMQITKFQTEGADEDNVADFISLLNSSHEQFSWGDEELSVRGYARLSLNLLISSYKTANEFTQQLFSVLIPREYESLNILQDRGLLHSYETLLATNLDEFDVGLKVMGIEYELNGDEALVPLGSKDDLMYLGGAEFSIYNWGVVSLELSTFNVGVANRQEFHFNSGSDMDLGCWMSPDQSLILLVGQYGPFEEEVEIDQILDDFVPYIVGELSHTGKLIVASLSHETDSDPELWTNLSEGDDYLHITLNNEDPYLVVGWASVELWNDYQIDSFTKVMSNLNDWLAGAKTSEVFDLGLETTCVTLLKGEPLRRFREFCKAL